MFLQLFLFSSNAFSPFQLSYFFFLFLFVVYDLSLLVFPFPFPFRVLFLGRRGLGLAGNPPSPMFGVKELDEGFKKKLE